MPTTHPTSPVHKSADFATPAASPSMPVPRNEPNSQAQSLIDAAGSPDQAKQAIDEAARNRASPPTTQEDFARRWGFASFLEMFEASKPVDSADQERKWLLTALRGGKWLLWNEGDLPGEREFASREDALPRVPGSARVDNSSSAKHQG